MDQLEAASDIYKWPSGEVFVPTACQPQDAGAKARNGGDGGVAARAGNRNGDFFSLAPLALQPSDEQLRACRRALT